MEIFNRVAITLSNLKKKAHNNNCNCLVIDLEMTANKAGVSTIELREHLNILNTLGKIKLKSTSPDCRGQTRTLEVL